MGYQKIPCMNVFRKMLFVGINVALTHHKYIFHIQCQFFERCSVPCLNIIGSLAAQQKLRLSRIKHPNFRRRHVVQIAHTPIADLSAHPRNIILFILVKPNTIPIQIISVCHEIFVNVFRISGITFSKAAVKNNAILFYRAQITH